nr:MAG TPA: hypothetical protein [Caudoviricetes sp.]
MISPNSPTASTASKRQSATCEYPRTDNSPKP